MHYRGCCRWSTNNQCLFNPNNGSFHRTSLPRINPLNLLSDIDTRKVQSSAPAPHRPPSSRVSLLSKQASELADRQTIPTKHPPGQGRTVTTAFASRIKRRGVRNWFWFIDNSDAATRTSSSWFHPLTRSLSQPLNRISAFIYWRSIALTVDPSLTSIWWSKASLEDWNLQRGRGSADSSLWRQKDNVSFSFDGIMTGINDNDGSILMCIIVNPIHSLNCSVLCGGG